VTGAWLVAHFADGLKVFWRVNNIFAYVFLAALLSTALSATLGVASLALGGFVQWQQFPAVWLTWWLGDMVSDLIVAPFIIIWVVKGLPRPGLFRTLEGAALGLLLILVCQTIFLEQNPFGGLNLPLEYLTIPPLLWAAFRFGERGAVTSAFFVSGVALWGTLHSLGPFARPNPNEALLLLQAFMGTITLTAMVLALVVRERLRAEQRLQVQDAVSRVLADAATLKEATPRIFQALCEKGDWEFGAIWNIDAASQRLFCVGDWHVPSVHVPEFEAMTRQITFAAGIGLPGRVWAAKRPVWLPNVTEDANFPRAEVAARGALRAAICFPIKHGEEVLGVIECFSRRVRQPDENFLKMLEALGGQLGQFIQRENALRQQAYLANIVASSADAIISISLQGEIISWNKAAEMIFGYNAGEAIGRPIFMLWPPGQAAQEPQILQRIAQGESIDHYQTVRLRKDGQLIDISLSVSPIKDAAGQMVGASKIARDITEQKRIERALAEAQQQLRGYAEELEKRVQERTARLQETIKSLDSFCYSIAHDLRAPLRALSGFSNHLASDYETVLDEEGKDYLARIRGAAARMDQLILGLLEFGRLNTAELQSETVQLLPLIRKALIPFEGEIAHRQAQVQLKEPLLPVRASGMMLEQVFANLLGNALKFVPPSVLPQVEIWTEPREDQVRICVKDNGIGIKTEHAVKLFQPFVRLVNGGDYPGTGIGLAIVRKGVERMGGRVGLDSQLGNGSCFWIELPSPSGNGETRMA
jgi:PAS domain S-box-containing protein